MYRRDIPEQRKEQLINAAFETINVVGLAGVTLSQVAKEAGLSTGIVSHYFGDKEGLLSATMRKILRDLRDAVAECRAQAASDSQSQLFAIIRGNFHPSQTNAVSMRAARLLGRQHASAGAAPPAARQRSAALFQYLQPVPPRAAAAAGARRGARAGGDDRWALAARQPAGDETDLKQDCRIACDYVIQRLKAAPSAA